MIDYDNIPEELRRLKQWVSAQNDSKVPMCSFDMHSASSTDPTTWGTYDESVLAYENGFYDYCGFVFADNGYVGIDIDCGFDEDGFMSPLGVDIISHCKSYTEKSRSGRGFHILLRGNLPFKGKNNLAGVEIYKVARYFIMTGDIVNNYREIVDNQEAIDYVVDKYFTNVRESSESHMTEDKYYVPDWTGAVSDGIIKLRPRYPRITEGSRNLSLTSLAGMMHNQGYSREQIKNELLYANKAACDPPLDKYEINSIVNSVTRYKR